MKTQLFGAIISTALDTKVDIIFGTLGAIQVMCLALAYQLVLMMVIHLVLKGDSECGDINGAIIVGGAKLRLTLQ